jgi:hypothetical protein
MSDWVILERVLARWRRLVASLKAMNLFHKAILPVSYGRIAMAIKMASKVGVFCIVDSVYCRHGSRQGNT